MSDLFDRLEGTDPPPEDEAKQDEDPLAFLGGFKKRVKSGDVSSRPKKRQPEAEGITPLDIADLPDAQKRIMLALLRAQHGVEEGWTLPELEEWFADEANLTEILDELIGERWLSASGDPPHFRINLQRKKSRRLSSDIWSAISDE